AKLLDEGLQLFSDAFDKLLAAVEQSTQGRTTPKVSQQTYKLPANAANLVSAHVNDWRAEGKVSRLWERDPSLWTDSDEGNWLGWRSEERRVGKECRSGWGPWQYKRKK